MTPRGRGTEQHRGGGWPPAGAPVWECGAAPERQRLRHHALRHPLAPGHQGEESVPPKNPHGTSCVGVRRGHKARQKACGATTSGDRPSCVTLGTFFSPFLCCLPCVTSYMAVMKSQVRKQTVPHSPPPVPKEEGEIHRRVETKPGGQRPSEADPVAAASRSPSPARSAHAKALRFPVPRILAWRPSQCHSRGHLAPAVPL